jgi:hypothetical protein
MCGLGHSEGGGVGCLQKYQRSTQLTETLLLFFFVSNAACASGLVPFLMNLQSIRFVDFCLHKVGIDGT